MHYGLGYTGGGVGPCHLGGKILSALALGIEDEHTALPLVDLEMLRFPPEPFRSVGAALTQHAIVRKDEAEDRGERDRSADRVRREDATADGLRARPLRPIRPDTLVRMRTRFPALVLGVTLLAGSLRPCSRRRVATAPQRHGAPWAITGIDVSKWQGDDRLAGGGTRRGLRDHQGDRG